MTSTATSTTTYHTLGVDQQQVLSVAGLHAREHILSGLFGLAHQKVAIVHHQRLGLGPSELAMEPGHFGQIFVRLKLFVLVDVVDGVVVAVLVHQHWRKVKEIGGRFGRLFVRCGAVVGSCCCLIDRLLDHGTIERLCT